MQVISRNMSQVIHSPYKRHIHRKKLMDKPQLALKY